MSAVYSIRAATLLAAVTCFLLPGAHVRADEQKPYVHQESARLTATVASVDPQRRSIVLLTPSGERSEFQVGSGVKNFDQIKPGDRVDLNYNVAVAMQVQPAGASTSTRSATQQLQTAPSGSKPSAALTQTLTSTVEVQSVDTATNHVTFRRADGTVERVAIEDPEAQKRIRKLKPGDAVAVTYTEQTAISVRPALR